MERDKLYHIRGSVEGIYGFEVYQASRPSIRLHVPSEYRDRVEAGKIYNVHIKSINEVPLTDTQREILLWSKKGTRWKAVLERSSQVKVGLAEGTHDDWRSRKAYLLRTLKSDAYPDLVVAKPQYFGRVALGHGLGLGLRIPHTIVEKYKKNDLLEARVARISRPDEEYLLYTRVQYKRAHVCISQMRPANGEEFCIKSLRGFGKTDFARQFNERKPAGMWSTALICDGGKVFLRVDNLQAELRNCRLKAHSGNVVLEANLIDDTKRGSIRIVKRPQEFTVGFADRTRVTAMKGFGGKIEATYRVHSREPRPHVRIVEARAIGDPKSQGKAELQERELGLMSREEIRGWIDGEGHIECKPKKRFGSQIIITQKSREP